MITWFKRIRAPFVIWLLPMASLILLVSPLGALGQGNNSKSPEIVEATRGVAGKGTALLVEFKTNHGALKCRLFHKRAPKTVANFAGLATGNKAFKDPATGKMVKKPYYDGLKFHRVIPNFMIQGGCPEGTGRGGPGYSIRDEFGQGLKHDRGGRLSMANRGPNTGGSQFFVTEVPTPHLDNKHAVFGECRNLELVKKLARLPVTRGNRPREDVIMQKVKLSWGQW